MPEKKTNKTANWAEYQRQYRKANPDRALQHRLNAAKALLTRYGFTVTTPGAKKEG